MATREDLKEFFELAERLIELKNLLDQGVITQADFEEQKRKILG